MGLEGILTMLCLSCRGVWVRKGFTEEGVLKLALKVLKKVQQLDGKTLQAEGKTAAKAQKHKYACCV